jgi:hypothetical protein
LPFSLRHRVRSFLLRLNNRPFQYEPMSKQTEAMLRKKYLPEVQELERMTGLSLQSWYPK